MLPNDAIKTTNAAALGQAIRARRRESGVTQQQLADVIGVNRRVVGELENGKPTVQLAIALAAVRATGLDLKLHRRGT